MRETRRKAKMSPSKKTIKKTNTIKHGGLGHPAVKTAVNTTISKPTWKTSQVEKLHFTKNNVLSGLKNKKPDKLDRAAQKIFRSNPVSAEKLIQLLLHLSTEEGINKAKRFFKTEKGQYSAGDLFLGIAMPEIRRLAHLAKDLNFPETKLLLGSKWHEARMLGIVILRNQYLKANSHEFKKSIYGFTMDHLEAINNWDLVDTTAPVLIGDFLLGQDKGVLYESIKHENLWIRRIAIVATLPSIKKGNFKEILFFATVCLNDKQDLIHKACGWMLREVGKKDITKLRSFLTRHHSRMPRTMLRYAIEKMPQTEREKWLTLP